MQSVIQDPESGEGYQPVSTWQKDYHTTVSEMKTRLILTITFTGDTHASTVTKKHDCFVVGRTITDQDGAGTSHVQLCKPFAVDVE